MAQNVALNFDGNDALCGLGLDLTNDYTIEAWFNSSSTVPQTIFDAYPSGNPGSSVYLELNNGEIRFIHRSPASTGGPTELNSTPSTSLLNSWHHVAAVRTGTTLNLYIDGVLVDSDTDLNDVAENPIIYKIGNNHNVNRFFNGDLDEIRIWNEARTEDDIKATLNCEIQLVSSSLLAYYSMEDGTVGNDAALVTDVAGGDHPATQATTASQPTYINTNTSPVLSLTNCPIFHPTDSDDSGQTVTINCDEGYVEYYDDGGASWNYDVNADATWIAFCPSDPSCQKIQIEFGQFMLVDGDVFEIYQGVGITAPSVLFGSFTGEELASVCPKIPLDCVANSDGCLTIRFDPTNPANPTDKGYGWISRVSCIARTLELTCPDMAMVAGQFIDVTGAPSCNIQGRYTIPTPPATTDSECITNINYTVTLDLNGSGLDVVDVNGGVLEVGDVITITADDKTEIEKCIKLSYTATCGTSNVTASCTDQEVCLFAPSITSSNKKIGLNDGCKATITPQTFLNRTCDLLTYTLNVFDGNGDRVGDEDAAAVFVNEAGVYTVFINDCLSTVMCMITITDNQGPTCTATLTDQFIFCQPEDDIDLDNVFDDPSFSDCSELEEIETTDMESIACSGLDVDAAGTQVLSPPSNTLFTLDATTGLYTGIAATTYEGFEVLKAFKRTHDVEDEYGNAAQSTCMQMAYMLRPVFDASRFMVDDITVNCSESILPADLDDNEVPHFIGTDGEVYRLSVESCKYSFEIIDETEKPGANSCQRIIGRQYRIFNCCADQLTFIDLPFYQQITINLEGLTMTCPTVDAIGGDGVVDADPVTCDATINLTAPKITTTGSCASEVMYQYELSYPDGTTINNGGEAFFSETDFNNLMITVDQLGNYNLEITATSDCGVVMTADGKVSCIQMFTLQDVTAPTANCQDVTVDLNSDGTVTIAEDFVNNASSDACGVVTFDTDVTVFDCDALGANTVTLTVTDENNLTSTCSATVTVNANENCAEANCKLTSPLDFALDEAIGAADDVQVTIDPSDIDDGTSTGTLSVSTNGGTTSSATKSFNHSHIWLPTSPQTVTVTLVSELNGVTKTCDVTIRVLDQTKPTIDNCGSLEITINTNDPVELSDQTIIPPLQSNDNCDDGNLDLSFSQQAFDCGTDGPTGTVQITVTDKSGNVSDPCDITITCDQNRNQVAGRILDNAGYGLSNVQLHLQGQESFTIITDEKGNYQFPEMGGGNAYMLKPEKNTYPLNGVSTLDIVLLSQHLLGTQEFTTPNQYIAADVTKDGRLSVSDMIEIRQLILDKMDKFSNNNSWRFIDGNFEFPKRVNPLLTQVPESYLISELTEDMEINFVGVKVGDINGDASPNDLPGSGIRSAQSMVLTTEDMILEKGNTYKIPIRATSFDQIQGYQFSLDFDPSAVEIVGWEEGALEGVNDSHFGFRQMNEGQIHTSWVNDQQQSIEDGGVLFYIHLTANKEGSLKDVLSLNSNTIQAEAYKGESMTSIETMNVVLEYNSTTTKTDEMVLYQNRPNPFENETEIAFQMPQAAPAILVVFDLSGKMVLQQSIDAVKGYNKISLSANDLPKGNLYYYRLESAIGTATKKMVLIK